MGCLLRSSRWKDDQTFEGRHHLSELLKASRLLAINDDHMRCKHASEDTIRDTGMHLRAAMSEVVVLWNNNLRYASEARLKAFLKQIDRLQGIKGDPLEEECFGLDQCRSNSDRSRDMYYGSQR